MREIKPSSRAKITIIRENFEKSLKDLNECGKNERWLVCLSHKLVLSLVPKIKTVLVSV